MTMSIRTAFVRNIVLAALVSFGNITGRAQLAGPLVFMEQVHDFGEVVEERGQATQKFLFTNVSSRPVAIVSVKPSCGCTTPSWSKDPVPPGGSGYITAQFDPKGKPGYFNKTLAVVTDHDGWSIVLQIKGQVVKGEGFYPGEYRMANGAWLLRASSLNMGTVYRRDLPTVKDFAFYNAGDKPIHFLNKIDAPEYVRAEVIPSIIPPGDMGSVRISYYGGKRSAYGFQSDNIAIHTDDEQMRLKSFSVYATLEDDFSKLAPADIDNAPQLAVEETHDYGRIREGNTYSTEISITNTGKSVLKVNYVQPNCPCLEVKVSSDQLKPGASATLTVSFDTSEKRGSQQKALTIYTNDPAAPARRVLLTAYIET